MLDRLPVVLALLILQVVFDAPAAVAQDITNPLAATDKSAPTLPPDPRSLSGNWWRYFQEEGKLHTDRFDAARKRLDELVAQIDEPSARAALQRFNASLQALADLNTAPPPAAEAAPLIAETYTLTDLIELEKQRLELASAVELERGDTERQESAAAAARKRLDARFAVYLSQNESGAARLTMGLAIMAERAAAALAERRAARARATLVVRENSLAVTAKSMAAARTRLQARPDALATLKPQIDTAQQQLNKANQHLLDAQNSNVPASEDSVRARAAGRLRGQQVVHASVLHAQAQAELYRLEAHRDWVSLRTVTPDEVDAPLQARHDAGRAFLERVAREGREWQAATQRELLNMTDLDSGDKGVAQLTRDRFGIAQETLQALERLRRSVAEMRLVSDLVDETVSGRKSILERGVSSSVGGLRTSWQTAKNLLGSSLFRIGDTPVTTLGIVRLMLILLVALWVSRLFRGALTRFSSTQAAQNQAAFYTIGRLAHYLLIVVGLIVGLSSIGLNLGNLALVAGALSVGIGFGLQSIVNNFVSGLIILFERSLKVGDFIELDSGLAGTVKEINVRSTLINTNDNIDIVVPNSEFVSARLTNWTLRDVDRRAHISFGVAYGSDKEKVREVVLAAANRVPFTRTAPKAKAPEVWLVGFGDSSLDFELVVWLNADAVRRPSAVNAQYTWEIETALGQAGIEIPFPQRDLHLRSGFAPLQTNGGGKASAA